MVKCPNCKKGKLIIKSKVEPEGLKVKDIGWNKDRTVYTEGRIDSIIRCSLCDFKSRELGVF